MVLLLLRYGKIVAYFLIFNFLITPSERISELSEDYDEDEFSLSIDY